MKTLLIILSGVSLVNNQPETIKEANTATKTVAVDKLQVETKNIATGVKKALKTNSKKTKKAQKKKKATKKSTNKVKNKNYKSKKKKKTTYKKTTRVRYNIGENQAYAHQLIREYGWSEDDYNALVLLWYRESGWNPNAVNKSSGACGIPQAKPCSKMSEEGKDYRTNYKTQIRWGLKYIKRRYGTPSEAYRQFLSRKPHWY